VGFSRQFTGGFDDVADARRFVAATLLRDTELYEAARLLVDEAITNPLLHSEACATARTFQVTITFRPDLLHVEVHDRGARNRSTAGTPTRPRWPGAASSCSTPWPSTGIPPPSRTAPATWSGSSWKPDPDPVVGLLRRPVSSALNQAGCPSGQRERSVKSPALPTQVRILSLPHSP
jgi:Histidine kinase-like ATPase domain